MTYVQTRKLLTTNLEQGTRICTRCKEDLPFEKFCKLTSDPVAGRQYMCKDCQVEARRERQEANPSYYQDIKLRHRYGISYEVYEQMLEAQNGVCAICQAAETYTNKGNVKWLGVDHDHETGKVRGLLCYKCNMAIGWLDDDPQRMSRAITYLEGGLS